MCAVHFKMKRSFIQSFLLPFIFFFCIFIVISVLMFSVLVQYNALLYRIANEHFEIHFDSKWNLTTKKQKNQNQITCQMYEFLLRN